MSAFFNHAFSFAFSIDTADPTGEHIPVADLRAALVMKLAAISDTELLENLGTPFDTYEHSSDSGEVQP